MPKTDWKIYEIQHRHYDAVLEPSKAAAWWEIHPKGLANVVSMKAVA